MSTASKLVPSSPAAPAPTLIETIVFFDNFGPPALTLARTWRAMGIDVYLLMPGKKKPLSSMQKSCFSGSHSLDPNLVGTPAGIDAILAYLIEVKANALTTLAESNGLWLARNADRFRDTCKLMLPSAGCLEAVASKKQQIARAREAGFQILPTYTIHGPADAANIDTKNFPLCLRPATADAVSPYFRVEIVQSPGELAALLTRTKVSGDGLVAQPYRNLPNALLHCTSSEDGTLLEIRGFLVDRKFEGYSLRIRPMDVPEDLVAKVANLSRTLGLTGPYHFDFLYSPDTREWLYLELNLRFGGTTDQVIWLGVNEPANCLDAYGLKSARDRRKYPRPRAPIVNKRKTLKHLLTVFKRRPNPLDFPRESRSASAWHSLRDLFLAKDSVADSQDLTGTLAYHLRVGGDRRR